MLSQSYRDILRQTAMGALTLANCQILVNSVRPGSWNTIVPISGVSYADAMALIIDAADGQGWLHNLVQRLVDDYPARPEFRVVLKEIVRDASSVAEPAVSQHVLVDLTEAESAEAEIHRTPTSDSISWHVQTSTSEQPQSEPRKYTFAFSFADEDRDYVQRVARVLQRNGIKVFTYTDAEVRAASLGKNLNIYLQGIYRDDADFAVLFISKAYTERPWTKAEVKFAHERAIHTDGYILPARFDDSKVPGLDTNTGYEDLRKMEPEDFAQLLIRKLHPAVSVKTENQNATPRSPTFQRKWIRRGIGAATAVILAVLATFLWPNRLPPSVAVVAIENESGRADGAWVGTAISELLTSDLETGPALCVTPRDEVARMRRDLQLGDRVKLSPERLEQIRTRLAARWVIVGSYRIERPDDPDTTVWLRLQILDAANGKEIAATTGTGSAEQLGKLTSRAAQDLRTDAKLPQLSNAEKVLAQAALPRSSKGLRLYSEALIQLRRHDARSARELLSQAAAIENHPLIHSALGDAHLALQDRGLAAQEARKAVAVAGNLSNETRWQLQARTHELASPPDWIKAVELRRQLWAMTPRKLEHGLRLADTQISQGQQPAALVTLDELREASSDDPRIELVQARAHQQAGEFAKQKKSGQAAAAKAEAMGATSLAGEARLIEATAHFRLGDRKAMDAAIKEARAKFYAARDDYGEARALEHVATTFDLDGAYDDERDYLDLAMKIHLKRRDEFAVARVRLNKGTTFYSQDRMEEALPLYEMALKTFKELDTPYQHGATLSQKGAVKFFRGDLEAAQALYQEALAEFERTSDRSERVFALTNLGEVYECRGDLERALELHEESLGINRTLKDRAGIAYDLFRLGEVESNGDPAKARARYAEALKEYSGLVESGFAYQGQVADTHLAMAELDRSEAAQKSLRAAEAIFDAKNGPVTERPARRLALTAKSLLEAGQQQTALALADRALSQTHPANLRVRLPIEVTRAGILAKSGKQEAVEAALASLHQTAATAHKTLFVLCEWEARLAAAEIEEDAGRPEAASKLAALAVEANKKGFVRIATRASRP